MATHSGNKGEFGPPALAGRICLLLACLLLPASDAITTEQQPKIYSVPTLQFLELLSRQDGKALVRVRAVGDDGAGLQSFQHTPACRLSKDGVFTARRVSAGQGAQRCEWLLFHRDYSLTPGWVVQRLHWAGDIDKARFRVHPVKTANAYMRVVLPIPARGGENRITLRLVTLAGPADGKWQDAVIP